jgi:hypothetical protein
MILLSITGALWLMASLLIVLVVVVVNMNLNHKAASQAKVEAVAEVTAAVEEVAVATSALRTVTNGLKALAQRSLTNELMVSVVANGLKGYAGVLFPNTSVFFKQIGDDFLSTSDVMAWVNAQPKTMHHRSETDRGAVSYYSWEVNGQQVILEVTEDQSAPNIFVKDGVSVPSVCKVQVAFSLVNCNDECIDVMRVHFKEFDKFKVQRQYGTSAPLYALSYTGGFKLNPLSVINTETRMEYYAPILMGGTEMDPQVFTDQAIKYLNQGGGRSLTLFGHPGTGKTTIAKTIARSLDQTVAVFASELILTAVSENYTEFVAFVAGLGKKVILIMDDFNMESAVIRDMCKFLDGLASPSISYVFVTNTDVAVAKKACPAFYRPGRSLVVEITKFKVEAAKQVVNLISGGKVTTLPEGVSSFSLSEIYDQAQAKGSGPTA